MNRLMKEYELNIPDYEEVSGNFLVTFKRRFMPITEQVTEQVAKLLIVCAKEALSSKDFRDKLGISHRPAFLYNYLKPAWI